MTERRRPGQRRTLCVSLRACAVCSRLRLRPTFMATYGLGPRTASAPSRSCSRRIDGLYCSLIGDITGDSSGSPFHRIARGVGGRKPGCRARARRVQVRADPPGIGARERTNRAAAERRTRAEDLRAMACDPVARRFAQDLDAALGEPLPLAREAWWKG